MHLGNLLLADGRGEEAAAEFRALLATNADEKILAQAGRALLDTGQYALALPFLDRAGARLDRAVALFHTAGADEALAALAQVPAVDQSGELVLLKARILDSEGRIAEAQQLLAGTEAWQAARPLLAEHAALLLAKYGRYREAALMLARATAAAPDNRGLLLSEAIVLALDGRVVEAERRLKQIEERWPEWDRPYRVHGLMLSATKRDREAAQKLRTAAVLGSADTDASCPSLQDWLLPSCHGGAP
jgi:Flp pilus assembly protein TadD